MKRIILKPGEERRILDGHPWIYDNETARILEGPDRAGGAAEAVLEPGECADVESSPPGRAHSGGVWKRYLGRAIVNPCSHIIARLYSPSKEGLDTGFFKRRIRKAIERRIEAGCGLAEESARLVFAEADFLPGLIIDRYVGTPVSDTTGPQVDRTEALQSWLCIQFLAYGMYLRREIILKALEEVLAAPLRPNPPDNPLGLPSGIFEKSAPVQELEGIPRNEGLLAGSFPPEGIIIAERAAAEGPVRFLADLAEGQKTGHFLDQRDNHRRTAEFARSLFRSRRTGPEGAQLRALDCFCYTGGFALHIARALTETAEWCLAPAPVSIIAVDASAAALEALRKNAALNGTGDCIETVEADVFDFLRREERRGGQFDLIVLDPPAFAKSRSALEGAVRGYKEINLRAMKLLAKGGVLVTCSCSHAVSEGHFKRIIAEAAIDAGRRLVQLDFKYQPPDHPILLGYDESAYLKCGFYRAG
jgi:23S rRNA (cytosine1962-C5)-methyltransferase